MRRGRKRVANPETARRILAAAENHFAAQGLAGARTDEIAAAAHANKAMLFYYFGDKRRLHRAVLGNLLRQLRVLFDELAVSKASPRRRLEISCSATWIFSEAIQIIRAWFSAKRWNPAPASSGFSASFSGRSKRRFRKQSKQE